MRRGEGAGERGKGDEEARAKDHRQAGGPVVRWAGRMPEGLPAPEVPRGPGARLIPGTPWLLASLLLGGCTLDLTDPPLVGDGPARLSIAFTVNDLEGSQGCWSMAVLARPVLRQGFLVPVSDSTIRVAGETLRPDPRPHELASFRYQTPTRCGERPGSVSLEVPFLDGAGGLNWPLGSLPMPWEGGTEEVQVPPGGTAVLSIPIFPALLALPGEPRLDWTARVSRAPDAAEGQDDHLLLTNASESPGGVLRVGPPFTTAAGSRWEVSWGIFTRMDHTTPSEELEASLQYGILRLTRLRVGEGEFGS